MAQSTILKNTQHKVLWENNSPSSTFDLQYINLNDSLANYQYIMVAFARSKSGDNYQSTGFIPANFDSVNLEAQIGGYFCNRTLRPNTNSQLIAADCKKVSSYGSTTETTVNDYIVPRQIIGIK